jgi:hypothetical protein
MNIECRGFEKLKRMIQMSITIILISCLFVFEVQIYLTVSLIHSLFLLFS